MNFHKNIKLTTLFTLISIGTFAQKTFKDATIAYSMRVDEATSSPKLVEAIKNSVTNVYISSNSICNEFVNPAGMESTIYYNNNGTAIILKCYSQKLMIKLTKENWISKNKLNNNISFTDENETKTILGYTCKKAIGKMIDGNTFVVYYTNDIIPANKMYDNRFSNLQGLVLEYEVQSGKTKFTYIANNINFDVVPASKFETPNATSGYRVETYTENQNLKKGDLEK